MHKKLNLAAITASLFFGAGLSASAQTATTTSADQTPTASAPRATDFAQTRRVLAKSNLCEWYSTGGIAWDYAGQQTFADWTAATQAVTTELRATDPSISGDRLMRLAEQRIGELCAGQVTHTAGSI